MTCTFPAVGETQCHMAKEGGVYFTWHTYENGRRASRRHRWLSASEANFAHDCNIDVLRIQTRSNQQCQLNES